jgi:hypothetical protein
MRTATKVGQRPQDAALLLEHRSLDAPARRVARSCFACGGDDWYEGTATITTDVHVGSAPPETETTEAATSMKFRADMGGETVTLYVAANAPCLLSVDGFSEEQPRPLSFLLGVGCTFETPKDPAMGTLTEAKGTLVAEESLSLDLTFSLEPAQAGAPPSPSTLRLSFQGRARSSD